MSTYAVSDLHGHLELWKEIEKFLKPNDKVFVLGDCGDRGPQPWETIKAVYANPQAIYLKGNHEDMLVKAMEQYIDYEYMGEEYSLLCYNGGAETFEEWLKTREYQREWKIKLSKLPTEMCYLNQNNLTIVLNHSGVDTLLSEHDKLWNREHFTKPNQTPGIYIHGHTPNQYLAELFEEEWEGGAFWYCGDTKCCLDQRTIKTKQVCLLDLDTFDEHIFCL